MNFSDFADPNKLAELQQQVFQDMVASHGLTLDEASQMLGAYRHQVAEATEKYRRAHQQAVMRLDAALRDAASRKRKPNDS